MNNTMENVAEQDLLTVIGGAVALGMLGTSTAGVVGEYNEMGELIRSCTDPRGVLGSR